MQNRINKLIDFSGDNFSNVILEIFSDIDFAAMKPVFCKRSADYLAAYGFAPADEYIYFSLLLNEAVHPENMHAEHNGQTENTIFFESGEWMLYDELPDIKLLSNRSDFTNQLTQYNFLLTLLTGAERCGSDDCGDGCLISLFSTDGSAPVFRYDHEVGRIEKSMSGSITSFLARYFILDSDWDDSDSEDTKQIIKQIQIFEKSREKTHQKLPFYRDPERLFERAHWILQHPTGEPTYDFAGHMKHAPDYSEWESEKKLLRQEPQLANYWLLHHFFLGNDQALLEAVQLSETSASALTRFLAQEIQKAQSSGGGLGALSADKTFNLIAKTRKNAAIKLFEPQQRQTIAKERGEDRIERIGNTAFKLIEDDIELLWKAIEEYPADTAGHDRILKRLATLDANLKDTVKAYFSARSGSAHNEWPYDWELERGYSLDARLSLPISAAFISGLMFDEDNDKACAGITITLGIFDDDHTMDAWEQAIETLSPDDDRAEYVFDCLKKSKHVQATELLSKGAWRFFDIINEATRQQEALATERKKDGMSLNNMWDIENFFHIPLQWCLEHSDDAEKLARSVILEIQKNKALHKIFKQNFGRAMGVLARHGITEFNQEIQSYIESVCGFAIEKDTTIGPSTMLNLCEASIALAKLDYSAALALLPDMFKRITIGYYFDLDFKAALLGSMFILEPDNPDLIIWLKRLLGNRNNHERLIGALRSSQIAAEMKLLPNDAFSWIHHHLYSDTNRFKGHHHIIKEQAYKTMIVLGHCDLPPFNDDDKHAIRVALPDLAQALKRPHLHYIENVLKRIKEKKYTHPDLLPAIRDYLVDVLSYSADDNSRTFDGQWIGIKAMVVQKPLSTTLPFLMELLDLEYCKPGLQNDIIFLMRLIKGETSCLTWLLRQSLNDLLGVLRAPSYEHIGFLDLIAGRAYLLDSVQAKPAIEECLRLRFQWRGGHFADENSDLIRLPLLYARYGNSAKALLKELHTGIDKGGEYGLWSVAEQLEKAVKLCKVYSVSLPEIVLPETLPPHIALKCDLKGENYSSGKQQLDISIKNAQINLQHTFFEMSFSNAFDEKNRLSKALYKAKDKKEAHTVATELFELMLLLGYTNEQTKTKRTKKENS